MTDVRTWFNPDLVLAGIVVNRDNPRRLDSRAHGELLMDTYGAQLLVTPFIPEREVVSICATNREPLPHDGVTKPVFDALTAVAERLESL